MSLNDESKIYLEDFKTYLIVEKNFSKNTARAYYSDILSYLLWLNDSTCINVNYSKIREYLYYIQKFDYKKTTLARKIASIRTFYKYLYREKVVDSNPASNLKAPKRPKPLPKFLTTEEIDKIISGIKIDTPSGYRNRAILELLWTTGMRVSELSGINFGDLNLENNEITVLVKEQKKELYLLPIKQKNILRVI